MPYAHSLFDGSRLDSTVLCESDEELVSRASSSATQGRMGQP